MVAAKVTAVAVAGQGNIMVVERIAVNLEIVTIRDAIVVAGQGIGNIDAVNRVVVDQGIGIVVAIAMIQLVAVGQEQGGRSAQGQETVAAVHHKKRHPLLKTGPRRRLMVCLNTIRALKILLHRIEVRAVVAGVVVEEEELKV